MHRIEGENHTLGDNGEFLFRDGPPGTTVPAAWLNTIQEEIVGVLDDAGVSPYNQSNDVHGQLIESILAIIAREITSNIVSATKTENYTVLTTDNLGVIFTNGNNPTITLPAIADSLDREILVMNIHATGWSIVDGSGAETINGLSDVPLYSKFDYIKVKADDTEWRVIDQNLRFDSGFIARSDASDVSIGFATINYDNLSGTFELGEVITENTSLATGVLLSDTGSTMVLMKVTGGGNFDNNQQLSGGTSGATADVDGTIKNTDMSCPHSYGVELSKLDVQIYEEDDATLLEEQQIHHGALESGSGAMGIGIYTDDANSITTYTGAGGFRTVGTSAGSLDDMAAADTYYKVIVRVRGL